MTFRTYHPRVEHLQSIVDRSRDHGVPAKTLAATVKKIDHAQQLADAARNPQIADPTADLASQLATGDTSIADATKIFATSGDHETTIARAKQVFEAAQNGATALAAKELGTVAEQILTRLDKVVKSACDHAHQASRDLDGIRTGEQAMNASPDVRAAWGVALDAMDKISDAQDLAHDIRSYGLIDTDRDAYEMGLYDWNRPDRLAPTARRIDPVLAFLADLPAEPAVRLTPTQVELEADAEGLRTPSEDPRYEDGYSNPVYT